MFMFIGFWSNQLACPFDIPFTAPGRKPESCWAIHPCRCEKMRRSYQNIWVNYHNRTLFSRTLESWFRKGNHPKMAQHVSLVNKKIIAPGQPLFLVMGFYDFSPASWWVSPWENPWEMLSFFVCVMMISWDLIIKTIDDLIVDTLW